VLKQDGHFFAGLLQLHPSGTDVMIFLKKFRQKMAKKWRFLLKMMLVYAKNG
jgi:hypothetical protein